MTTPIDFEFKPSKIRPGITLLHHRSSKWKTEVIKLIFVGDLKERLAERALGAYLLRHGHGKKKGMERVSRFMQDLYGSQLGAFVTKSFGRHLLALRGATVDAQYAPGKSDPLARLLSYTSALLNDPYLARPKFPVDDFQREQRNLLRAIAAQSDNKAQYANQRLMEEMFPDHPYGRPSFGTPDEVAALTPEAVADEMVRAFQEEPLFIYVVSPRKTSELKSVLKAELELGARPELKSKRVTLPPIAKRVHRINEYEDLTQGRLAMGYRIEDYKRRSDGYAAVLGDMLLGGVSSSRLFKEIREKRSLAYSVGSGLDPSSGVCAISAGVDPDTVKEVSKLAQAQVKALAKGKFTEDDLQPVYASFRKHLLSLADAPDSMINFNLGQLLGGRSDKTPMAVYNRYRRVKFEKIIDVMGRMKLNTVFTLTPAEVLA